MSRELLLPLYPDKDASYCYFGQTFGGLVRVWLSHLLVESQGGIGKRLLGTRPLNKRSLMRSFLIIFFVLWFIFVVFPALEIKLLLASTCLVSSSKWLPSQITSPSGANGVSPREIMPCVRDAAGVSVDTVFSTPIVKFGKGVILIMIGLTDGLLQTLSLIHI